MSMIQELFSISDLRGLLHENCSTCTVEATVATGFESIAKEECTVKLGSKPTIARGRIIFDIEVRDIAKVLKLRGVDNCYVLLGIQETFPFSDNKEECLEKLNAFINELDWKKGLEAWKIASGFVGTVDVKPGDSNGADYPTFRATCYRAGKKHCFSSEDVARSFGGAVNDRFNWKVNLTSFDVEVVVTIFADTVYVGLAINKQTLHKRNISHFGPTTLRATICYNLLALAYPSVGDVILDPMCGGGSLPIEGSLGFPSCTYICGDIHEKAYTRTRLNVSHLNENSKTCLPIDIYKWNVTRLPLRENSVDVVVTDLPFGKRQGSRWANGRLYPLVLLELARVCRVRSARAVLLTADRTTMFKCLRHVKSYWKQKNILKVNIGGLNGGVFVLDRTETPS